MPYLTGRIHGCEGAYSDVNSETYSAVHSNSQLVVNDINEKINVPKEIINLVEEIKYFLNCFNDSRVLYCNKVLSRNVDTVAKKAHL